MERYEVIKDIGSGNFGVAKLVRDVRTKELFAVKFIERGMKVCAAFESISPLPYLNRVPLSRGKGSILECVRSVNANSGRWIFYWIVDFFIGPSRSFPVLVALFLWCIEEPPLLELVRVGSVYLVARGFGYLILRTSYLSALLVLVIA